MRTDSAASLIDFHNTIKQRLTSQFHLINSIDTYANHNHQLQSLESAASLLKDTCARELIKLIEHAANYPEKFEKEFLTIELFNNMLVELHHFIYKCIERINAIKIKVGGQTRLFDYPDEIQLHLNQIDEMLNKNRRYVISENRYSLMPMIIPKKTNRIIFGEVISIDAVCHINVNESAVLGVVCVNPSALTH